MYTMTMPKPAETLDASMLPQLVELYFAAKQPDVATKTLTCYREQLAPFLRWFEEQCADGVLSRNRLADFVTWMRTDCRTRYGTKPSTNTTAHAVARVKGFGHWAYQAGCTGSVNLAEWTPAVRKRQSRLYFPTVAELGRLFTTAHGPDRLRDLAIFGLLLSTGMRLMEAANATVGAITWNTPIGDLTLGHDHGGTLHLRKVKFDAAGEGPGRTVVFCATAGLLLKVWLRAGERGGEDTLFDLTDSGISQVVKRRAKDAGLPELSPHAFRRAFADHWQERHGHAGLGVLKRQLGHSLKGDVTQASYIDQRNHRRVAAEIAKWHVSPLEGIPIDWQRLPVHVGATPPAA